LHAMMTHLSHHQAVRNREEIMAESEPSQATNANTGSGGWFRRVGADWWATVFGLAVTALAVAGVLPKIPW
jgi:hypothetical protein